MSYSYDISSTINKKLKEQEEKDKEKTNDLKDSLDQDNSLSDVKTVTIANEKAKKEETTQDNTLKSKTANEVLIDLKDIENKYSQKDYVDAPESLGLEKVDVPNKSEEELKSLAKSSLDKKYGDKKTTTNDSFAKQIDSILASKEDLRKSAQEKQKYINNVYDEGIKETENQMLKRGLARSSIVIGEISELEGAKAGELAEVLSTLQNDLSSAEIKLKNLESQKEDALKNLDIEYALELEEEIENVTKKYQDARNEAIEFNNNIQKLEAEYKLKLDKQKLEKQTELTKLKDEYGYDYVSKQIKNEQFNYLKEYFDSLDTDYAFNLLLTNKEFKSILGDRYSEMYQYLKSK